MHEFLSKIKPIEIQDDLKQYAFAVLCEKPDDFIIELHNRKQLRYYFVKIVTNSVFSDRSGFYKLHHNSKEIQYEIPDVIDDSDNYHELIDQCANEVKNIYWYNAELLSLYSIHGTYRAVSEITNIPVKSVHNAIKKAKQQIKHNINKTLLK